MRPSHLWKPLMPAALAVLTLALALSSASAQEAPRIELDADPTGNTATTAGPADSCVAVQPGDNFDIQILVFNVEDLLVFDIYVDYDEQLLEVTGRDTDLFLHSNAGSRVTDASSGVPDSDGRYDIAAVDTSDPARPDSGSGALAQITFAALAEGTAEIGFTQVDLESDGVLDVGPRLADVNLMNVGDSNGDTFFDGDWPPIEVRIGGTCDGANPSVSGGSEQTPQSSNGGTGNGSGDGGGGIGALALIAIAAGAFVVAGAVLAGGRYLLRRANRPAV